MALETAGNREDVEQERRAGITATARVLGVEAFRSGFDRASRFHKAAGDSQ